MLYIVGTPIGNLKELTFRAKEVLESVDYIACEDTRTSGILFSHYNIKKPTISYHKFNETQRLEKIITDLKDGKNIALVSDAGMPGISDPGNILVNKLKEENIEYTVISGPSALINSFVLSGFQTPFTFIGFLPEKNKDKKELLKEVSIYNSTLIFYVASHDIHSFFETALKELGDRNVCVVRELTKKFEEKVFTTLSLGYNSVEKGEFVVLIEKQENKQNKFQNLTIEQHVQSYMNSGLTKNDAIKQVAKDRNVKKNDIYKLFVD